MMPLPKSPTTVNKRYNVSYVSCFKIFFHQHYQNYAEGKTEKCGNVHITASWLGNYFPLFCADFIYFMDNFGYFTRGMSIS